MRRRAAALAFVALVAAPLVASLACSPSRDVVPVTRDVRVVASTDDAAAPGGYTYVARRAHGAIGLAGARNITDDDARAIVEHLADELESCARRLEQAGSLADGAARFVAAGVAPGKADVSDIELPPGGPVAANALLCIIAPVRATPFPPPRASPRDGGGAPAVLLEATWAPVHTGKGTTPRDGGAPIHP